MRIGAAILLLGWVLAGPLHAQVKEEAVDDEEEGRRFTEEQDRIAKKIVTHGVVCPDPAQPCAGHFRPNELSFKLLSEFKFDRGRDRSLPFYAVILKSGPLCSITDEERVAAQSIFPRRKVFVHQFRCGDFSDSATYTNVNRKAGFLAVYAGKTEAEAKQFLEEVKAGGKFPGANLRRMQVVVVYQLE